MSIYGKTWFLRVKLLQLYRLDWFTTIKTKSNRFQYGAHTDYAAQDVFTESFYSTYNTIVTVSGKLPLTKSYVIHCRLIKTKPN